MEVVRMKAQSVWKFLWEWRKRILQLGLWYGGLVYFRDELEMGEFYLLLSGFWVIYLIGFSPRLPGELSAYSHFNENHERILGSMDPVRAGRELTGQIFLDNLNGGNDNDDYSSQAARSTKQDSQPAGRMLGRGLPQNDDDDADLQKALLLSLRADRESRKSNK
jgi:hypothetical protein